MSDDVFYGSAEGGFTYGHQWDIDWGATLGLGFGLGAAAAALALVSLRLVDRWPILVVVVWLVFGTTAQRAIRMLAPYPDRELVGTPLDHYHHEVEQHPPGQFLREFRHLLPELHFHVRANLAGKVLFYHALRPLYDTPERLVWLLVAAANLGAVLAYGIASRIFKSRRAGLCALILVLFLPSKLYFTPFLNTVTPTFILLPLWLLVRYLDDRRAAWLPALGAALYWLVLFEPLPLVTGLTFIALLARAWGQGVLARRHILAVLGIVPAAFFALDAVVWWRFEYEIVDAFAFALEDAVEFNRLNHRPYWVWVVHNPLETLAGTGFAVSVLLLGIAAGGLVRASRGAARDGWRAATRVFGEPAVCLAVSVVAALAVITLMGVNRGETLRLWIFLGAFAQLPVAGFCAPRPILFAGVVGATVFQATYITGTRIFTFPGC